MKIIATFQTVEHFWRVYDHLIRPNEFKFTTDYHLFKEVRDLVEKKQRSKKPREQTANK